MPELCVDASVAIKFVVTEADSDKALALLHDSRINSVLLIAPPLFHSELDSCVRQRVYNGTITREQGKKVYAALDIIIVEIVEPYDLRQKARDVAEQFNQKLVYDSQYAALAALRGCELWTADTRFHRVVKNDLLFVKHIMDYI